MPRQSLNKSLAYRDVSMAEVRRLSISEIDHLLRLVSISPAPPIAAKILLIVVYTISEAVNTSGNLLI
jgi:hypothetical protein